MCNKYTNTLESYTEKTQGQNRDNAKGPSEKDPLNKQQQTKPQSNNQLLEVDFFSFRNNFVWRRNIILIEQRF